MKAKTTQFLSVSNCDYHTKRYAYELNYNTLQETTKNNGKQPHLSKLSIETFPYVTLFPQSIPGILTEG